MANTAQQIWSDYTDSQIHCILIRISFLKYQWRIHEPDQWKANSIIQRRHFKAGQESFLDLKWHIIVFKFSLKTTLPRPHQKRSLCAYRWTSSYSRYRNWLWTGQPKGQSSSPGRVKNFLFCTSSRPALGPTQPPIQRVPGAVSSRVKRPEREVDHSPPTSAEVKKMWIYKSIHSICLQGVLLN
jgi:hypothetical protein